MTIDGLISVASFGIQTAMMVSAPVLLAGLAAGVMISMFQAATQINDAALAFIPKIAATVLALSFFGHWMMSRMATFTAFALDQIPSVTN